MESLTRHDYWQGSTQQRKRSPQTCPKSCTTSYPRTQSAAPVPPSACRTPSVTPSAWGYPPSIVFTIVRDRVEYDSFLLDG
jgi:hypothetical protein